MWNDVLALNRVTRMLVVVTLVCGAWVGALTLAARPEFAIRTVLVHAGNGGPLAHLSAGQVALLCVPRIRGTFFTADMEQVRAAFDALPWVRRASVRRQWPDRLVVTIEEHQVLARWNDEAGNRFVNQRGEAFDAPGETALGAALPLLRGPEGTEKDVARQYASFHERLSRIGKAPRMVTLSPRQAWTIRLADGLVLEVGREQPASTVISRVERFVAYYAATVGGIAARVEGVDLRYPNGFAARVHGMRAPGAPGKPAAAARAAQTKPRAAAKALRKPARQANPRRQVRADIIRGGRTA